jgi:hypothetical protein
VQTYLVYEPPNPPEEPIKRAERMVFVREGFSWMAFLFTPFWLLFNRMWLAFFLYVIAMMALSAAFVAADLDQHWLTIASLAVHLAIGFEAGSLRRWSLERRRWRMLGAVVGPSLFECERRFFEAWLDQRPARDRDTVRLVRSEDPPSTQPANPTVGPNLNPVGSEA